MHHHTPLTQVALCLIASGTMISSGMNVAFPSVALPAMHAEANFTHETTGLQDHQSFLIASLPQITMVVGCLAAGPILDSRGRRLALLLSTLLASAGWLFMSLVGTMWSVYLSRLVTGLAMGLTSPAVSVFVSEIASANSRSALTVIKTVAFSLGVTLTYLFGYFYKREWRTVCLLCGVFPTCCFLLVLAYLPEPKLWKNRRAKRGPVKFLRPEVTKPMMLMSAALILRQISGTTALLSYAVDIVRDAGVDADSYLIAVGLGITRLLAGILAVWLSSRLGRRVPATWSGVAMSSSMLALASSFQLPAYALVLYVLTSTIHGAVPQAMVAEVFPTDVRAVATSMTTVLIYVTSFVALGIHQVVRVDRSSMFTYYGCCSVASTLFTIMLLPETHGKTFTQIQHMFNKDLKEDEEDIASPLEPVKTRGKDDAEA